MCHDHPQCAAAGGLEVEDLSKETYDQDLGRRTVVGTPSGVVESPLWNESFRCFAVLTMPKGLTTSFMPT